MAYNSSKYSSVDPIGSHCTKGMYNTRKEAEDMIRHIQETTYTRQLHAYQCSDCGMWHLSSSPGS